MYRVLMVLVTAPQVGLCHGLVRLEPPRGRRGFGFNAGWWDVLRHGQSGLVSARHGVVG